MNGRLKGILLLGLIVGAAYASSRAQNTETRASNPAETYRLVHAIGNSEKILAENMSERDCRKEKAERIKIVAALGAGGSVTCLPESLFKK